MAQLKNNSKQNNDKRLISGMNVGSSSILVTFVLLCLVTFAALSFVSANSDYKLSVQTANRTKGFYEANSTAEIQLAKIHNILNDCKNKSTSETTYYDAIISSFKDDDTVSYFQEDNSLFLNYDIQISEIQKISVNLKINTFDKNNTRLFDIIKWQNVSSYNEEILSENDSHNLLF